MVLFRTLWTGKGGTWKELAWIGPVNSLQPELRRSVSIRDKHDIMKRQKNKCNFCETGITSGMYSNCDLDHIVCISMGGLTVPSNLNFLCVACHRRKTSLENQKSVKFINMKPLKNQVYIVYKKNPIQERPLNSITPVELHENSDHVLVLEYIERRKGTFLESMESYDNIFERFKFVPN